MLPFSPWRKPSKHSFELGVLFPEETSYLNLIAAYWNICLSPGKAACTFLPSWREDRVTAVLGVKANGVKSKFFQDWPNQGKTP